MKKRIIPFAICLALLVSMMVFLPNRAEAAVTYEAGKAILKDVLKQDGTFPETLPEGQTTHTAYCYVCKAEKQWKPLTKAFSSATAFDDGGHYYLPTDVTINGQIFQFAAKTACLHTNGKTWTDENYRVALVNTGSVFNIMGGGTIVSDTKGTRGAVYSNGGTINIYGTTIRNIAATASTSGDAAITLYNSGASANLWGCTLSATVSPVILSNGTVNMYECTTSGPAVVSGDYAGQNGNSAKLNIVSSTLSGAKIVKGMFSVSGTTVIGGTGLELAEGKTVDPTALTDGASIAIAKDGVFTANGMDDYADFFCAADPANEIIATGDGALRCGKSGAVLVGSDGSETVSEDVLADWETGAYAYIKLCGDDAFDMNGQELIVDLAGYDLILTGTGKISAFDTANDTYDMYACGTILNNGSVTLASQFTAPNGGNYITVAESNRATLHRLDMQLTSVALSPSLAGLYYKAQFDCDSQIEEMVESYGLIVSTHNMPGADFKEEPEEGNYNAWTVATAFRSGVVANSGAVINIMRSDLSALENDQRAKMNIYANVYVDLGNGPIVQNAVDAGKSVADSDFAGIALSLYDVVAMVDGSYDSFNTATCVQLDGFYAQWKNKGMDWHLENIGKTADTLGAIDNSDIELKFDQGTTDAVCPVCNVKVTWIPLTDDTKGNSIQGHYYLPADITCTASLSAGYVYNGKVNTTACLHLNGHDITATMGRAVFGGAGRINIMGNGTVSGYNSAASGAAVQTNNATANNGVYIYGGIWKKTSNTSDKAAVLGTYTQGGTIKVYQGATIDAPGKLAVQSVTPQNRKSEILLYGCTVNGNVLTAGAKPENKVTASVEFMDCTVNGTVEIGLHTDVSVSGAPKIQSFTCHSDERLVTNNLRSGASIGVANDGIFTAPSGSAAGYLDYFYAADGVGKITVRDNALHCGRDYTGDLEFEEGTQNAMCPACGKVVTWIPVDGTAAIENTKANHYYLTQDVEFTAQNSELSFLSPGHGTYQVCFHLNGHNFTGTNTRFVYGGTSVTNIMGSGVVTGNRTDKYAYGSTVQINVSDINGTVNLYGGTWTQAQNPTNAGDYVISISDNGGTVNVHEGATVQANSNGKAIYVGASNMRDSILNVYGTVNGKVYAAGANQSKGHASSVTVDNGVICGNLDVNGVTTVNVVHAPKITLLDMVETSIVTMDTLCEGADITVLNEGVFTTANTSAKDYAQYFRPYYQQSRIMVQDDALRCKSVYDGKLYPDTDGKAYCPVCREIVVWTPVSSGEEPVVATAGQHLYLTKDIVYEGAYDGSSSVSFLSGGSFTNGSACFHLNGHNITATKSHGIYGGWGVLNVMGEGVVTGHAIRSNFGGAAQINNKVAGNSLNLYSGTYKNAASSAAGSAAVAVGTAGSRVCIYEDANVSNPGGTAVVMNVPVYRNSSLELYDATIRGDIRAEAANTGTYAAQITAKNVTVTGEVLMQTGFAANFDGSTKIRQLTLPKGVEINFANMKADSAVTVSAEGFFTPYMALADEWLPYITCADEGDWIIVRDKMFYQEEKQQISAATDADKSALDTTYAGTTVRYGEMHNHTNSGPYKGYSTGADGKYSLEQWIAEMDRVKMDFAFIVDHGMSIHMYFENFLSDYFIGGTEPGTTITDSKAYPKSPHYNMLFAYPEQLESIFFKWESKYVPIKWEGYEDGWRVKYPTFTTAEFGQLAKDVYDAGGLLVQVHPKYDSYIYSDDPLDYYFADYTGFEITTGGGKRNMMTKDNNEAYETWVDMLELGKKVWATAGSDSHALPDISALTTMYTINDHKDDYMAAVRAGNMAPGWIGIRMNVNGTAMGGETDFTGQRLQFSVGDIYNSGVKDSCNTPDPYVAGHTYRVELYDDGGLLMSSYIDPTEMNYFAVDCDETAMFYRVVVWDETDNERIGVSNPIWNTK